MWELLLQLRVLLPYLARIVPLLDRGLLKGSPDITELTKGMAEMQNGSRDLEVQARNQALHLERIEQQMASLRVAHENGIEDSRKLSSEIRSLRSWLLAMAILLVVLLLVCRRAADLPGDPYLVQPGLRSPAGPGYWWYENLLSAISIRLCDKSNFSLNAYGFLLPVVLMRD